MALAGGTACGTDPSSPISGAIELTPGRIESHTEHYVIDSTADEKATAQAGLALEAAYSAYLDFIGDNLPDQAQPRLRIRLYANRAEMQARSRPWAEAYYVDGVCHAYIDPSQASPHHWLVHEAIHQLNRERGGIAKEKWINEGLATYFGSSRYADGRLDPGTVDPHTYPIWWLKDWALSGDYASDVAARRIIPLRALVTGQGGPPIDDTVNAHYLGWWSLTHFLLHHDDGRYAAGFRQLIKRGGTLADFERHVGPVEQVEAEWYAYLQARAAPPSEAAMVLVDHDRGRQVPVQVYLPDPKRACVAQGSCPVALLSPGYGIEHRGYAFLANHFASQGFLVVAVQHDLPADPPLLGKGDLVTVRTPAWRRGAANLRFVAAELARSMPGYRWSNLTLVGHSNGGDISSLLLLESPGFAGRLITLDHRRVALPRDASLAVLSIRGSDFEADPGVLPSESEPDAGNLCVVEIPGSRHNDMHDGGPPRLKQEINALIASFLQDGRCPSPPPS